ncbi:DUF3775 domain-containing protein [Vibrio europaeus]|uniref:DUF3775 domain-containing protein n=1 Tax=Vibrio europaeus TaxID=300876 RepID=UPI00233F5E6B|nr:DUF3775 domain-containing protein [Vibrio europaeus]MDC5721928.1 DUF3775 domain-containing protein [Vibrio europaeus]MDC5758051.1 DUF3775 domain-containing protein [Vibrio europaeus]MDC5776370.1 DUF3775 domain-containing protein [Vibrio europaeus]MDC5795520.1 DUF3775 domain-containing protein [Vibrio europaeus]MDC5798306.1 DUF3775 domain-containing protein [Vibrio europaeus]
MNYLTIETVREVIELARICYPVTERSQVVSLSDALEEVPNNTELYQKVSSLTPDELAELQALMLIGRGASGESADDWGGLYAQARASQGSESVDYVASKYQLPEYLHNGLVKLGQ